MTPFDSYEISPCTRFEEPEKPGHFYFEVCEPVEADVWTLYGHIPGEGVMATGDFATRVQAEEAFQRITGIPFAETREVQDRVRVMHAGPRLLEELRLAEKFIAAEVERRNKKSGEGTSTTLDTIRKALAEADRRVA